MPDWRQQKPFSILNHVLQPTRNVQNGGNAGVWIRERVGMTMATIVARRGNVGTLTELVFTNFGCALPIGPRYVCKNPVAFIGIGRNKWLAIDYKPGLAAVAFDALHEAAAVSDQSSGYVLVEVGGSHAVEALAKGCNLDLDPTIFRAGDAASTGIFYTAVILWRTDVDSTYQIAIPRSWAPSFMDIFVAGAKEFGVEVFAPFHASDADSSADRAQVL